MHTLLNHRSVIRITGSDKEKFLQGLITNDINKASQEKAIYAAMLTAQGKYYSDFFIIHDGDSILVDLPALREREILGKLNIYKLRSNVVFTSCPEYKVAHFFHNFTGNYNTSRRVLSFDDPRLMNFGIRAFLHEEELSLLGPEDNIAYNLSRIENYLPEGEVDLIANKSFILEYGLDKLNAVDYNKGCYVGQEVVARTHYKGTIRKEIAQVYAQSDLPSSGSIIYSNEQEIGILCSVINNKALALVRRETMDLNIKDALINQIPVTLKRKES